MDFSTADLYDAHEGKVQVADPLFRIYGAKKSFYGQVVTVKCFEDNTSVKEILASRNGKGKVLVVDGGGSLRCALMGDLIATSAVKNEWEGVVIFGCIRDAVVINTLPLGVRALTTNPAKSVRRAPGEIDVTISFANISLHPNYYIYCDEDGILISEQPLLDL